MQSCPSWQERSERQASRGRHIPSLAQTSVSIFWTVLALGAMLFATRRINRWIWLSGAGLMAVVVVKLFIVDLAKVGGVERIVSFIAVGILMLVIGYVAPVPPRRQTEAA